jgi:hypothetical protein
MPGAAGRYEHVGVRFLNECDTAHRLVATTLRAAASGLDGAPLPIHDRTSLNACSRNRAPHDDYSKSLNHQ